MSCQQNITGFPTSIPGMSMQSYDAPAASLFSPVYSTVAPPGPIEMRTPPIKFQTPAIPYNYAPGKLPEPNNNIGINAYNSVSKFFTFDANPTTPTPVQDKILSGRVLDFSNQQTGGNYAPSSSRSSLLC